MTHKQTRQNDQKNTLVFGYGLFSLSLLGLVISTIIPWTALLFRMSVHRFNTVLMLIMFIIAAIVPPLVSYIIGVTSTRGADKNLRRYNGVLLGICSYWLTMLLTAHIAAYNWGFWERFSEYKVVFINGIPLAMTLAVIAIIASLYSKRQESRTSLLHHLPYQVVIVSVFATSLLGGVFNVVTQSEISLYLALMSLAAPAVLLLVSYAFIKHQPSKLSRLTSAVIAVSIFSMTTTIVSQTGIFYIAYNWTVAVPSLFGAAAWFAFLWLTARRP